MSGVVGGLRYRLIKDNFEAMLRDSLGSLGWFDAGRKHAPVQVIGHPLDPDEEIRPNKVSVSAEDMLTEEWEMGSSMEEHRWDFYVDIFAENDAIGLHLAGDVQDLVKGMMPDIGRVRPHLEVLDLRQATPSRLFFCQLEEVQMAKVRNWGHPWTQHWYTVLVEVVDYYGAGGDVTPEEPEEESYIFLGGAPGEVHELTILGGAPGEDHEITYIGGTP